MTRGGARTARRATVGGVVLAGGRSSRMGRAKADLDWHGVPLVVHVASAVATAVEGPVVVVAAPDQTLPAGLTVVRDPVEGRGPLQGLAAGLAAVDADYAFVCATDQPWAATAIAPLLATLETAGPPPGGGPPQSGLPDVLVLDPGQPLGALYATRLAATARARLDHDASLRGLLRAVDTRTVAGDVGVLRSLDTPTDYAEALRS